MANAQQILNTASQYLGTNDYNNYCEAFVEQSVYGKTGMYPSAIDAWVAQQKQAVQGSQGIQPGDTVYFSANKGNGGYGHTGIYIGNNQFISATYNGVQTNDLSKWQQSTGQQLLGYVPTGQSGNGSQIAQFAQSNGQMLNGQMTMAGNAQPNQLPQMMQNFEAQQHIAQSERLMNQAQTDSATGQSFMQQIQPQKGQSTIPSVPIQPQTPSQSQYPYGQYQNTAGTPTMPSSTSTTTGTQSAQSSSAPAVNATLPNANTSGDLSQPQANLNPNQQQPTTKSFGPISVTL